MLQLLLIVILQGTHLSEERFCFSGSRATAMRTPGKGRLAEPRQDSGDNRQRYGQCHRFHSSPLYTGASTLPLYSASPKEKTPPSLPVNQYP